MAEDDNGNLERAVRKLTVEHAETRWLALRLDDDVKELREELRAVRLTQQNHTEILQAHTGRFDSIDMQLRSLTHLVGEVAERLGEEPQKE